MLDWLRRTFSPGARAPAAPSAPDHASHKSVADAFSVYQSEDWLRAAALLQPLAAERPGDAEVLYRLGDAMYQLNRLQEAMPPLERAVEINGNSAAYLYKLGNVFKDLERPEEALERYRRALQLEPRHAPALNNTGAVLETLGKLDEALDYYRQAMRADATLLPARSNLAVLLHRMERYAEATEVYETLLQLQPDSIMDWCNLGNAYQGLGRYEDAVHCYERALALDPGSADAHFRSGVALLNLEKYPEAEAAARRAAQIAPTVPQGWVNLGNTLEAQARFDDALGAYEHGLKLNPNMPELLNNIGAAYKHKGALDKALTFFERAVAIAPTYAVARANLATLRYSLGQVDEAVEGYRAILKSDPQNVHAARHLLMALLYQPISNEDLFEEHLAFARRFASGDRSTPRDKADARSGGKLRVGYVSSDLCRHPVGFNLVPLVQHHDRDEFEVYFYSSVRQPDDITRWFREQADAWRSITNLSEASAAELIRKDGIDILVLLAGRFDDNRPLLATYRPAPVQVSMHDPATSGLAEMDYLIADRGLVPRRTGEKFTERVACLPTFYLHPPIRRAAAPAEPPRARDGRVTFGSFNNPAKLNEDVVALWAQVLRAVPGSRLMLRYQGLFSIPSVRARYLDLFSSHGISEDRLIIPPEPKDGREQHLARYHQIDIALDPFPFTGSTTTFEALCMGVPVVTMEGERMAARWSLAMMRKVGLADLVAHCPVEYVEIARGLASDPDELARLRGALPERVARSPLCAEHLRTRQLERLFRVMWKMHATGEH